ncbi:MAG: hypothetical protein AAGD13_11905 [Pseudomonadota bacterium]
MGHPTELDEDDLDCVAGGDGLSFFMGRESEDGISVGGDPIDICLPMSGTVAVSSEPLNADCSFVEPKAEYSTTSVKFIDSATLYTICTANHL